MHDENSCILLRSGHRFTHHICGIMAVSIVAYRTPGDL